MVSPIIERDPTDGQLTVAATEMRVAVTPWGNHVASQIDSAFITVNVERASVSGVLSREECVALSRQFALAADAIPVREAA